MAGRLRQLWAPVHPHGLAQRAGTYRVADGRGGADGGQQRFDPLNSWPDNASLDKARRLLWPVKQKYGNRISWADLIVLAGNVSLDAMGLKTIGFAGGRTDDWAPDLVYWGPEKKWLADERYTGDRQLQKPLAAVQMGLTYMNPEGPNGKPDPLAAARDIRETFGRMSMNHEETAALIAGGHTLGKAHGAHPPANCLGPDPAASGVENQGFGWQNNCGTGKGGDALTSGLEGAWTPTPVNWSNSYLDNLLAFESVQAKSPAGGTQWIPANNQASTVVPDAHDPSRRHAPIMFTTDLALKADPGYQKIAKRFQEHPGEFQLAFAKAWFKLIHRDLGPRARYLGPDVPKEDFIWQDPLPRVDHKLVDANDIATLKAKILATGAAEQTAPASASPPTGVRGEQPRGTGESVVQPADRPTGIQPRAVRRQTNLDGDLIVLSGSAAIEQATKSAGQSVQVPVTPGRADSTQAQTDVESFAILEPVADGFRNYHDSKLTLSPAEMLVKRAHLLTLIVPEMSVLRTLNANTGQTAHGVLTDRPGTLSNDFFVNLLDMSTKWSRPPASEGIYDGVDRKTEKAKWTATPVDVIFGSNTELRAIAEVYASADNKEQFAQDFARTWTKVMNLDRSTCTKRTRVLVWGSLNCTLGAASEVGWQAGGFAQPPTMNG